MRISSLTWMLLVCLILVSWQTGNAAVDGASGACQSSERTIAFTNVNLVPMTDDRVVAAQTVIVCDEIIVDVGQSSELEVPSNATIIDGDGAYLLPGLADMHMHTRSNWLDGTWPVSPFDLYLANGVTTIRDFGATEPSPRPALVWRDEIIKGKLSGPRMLVGARLGVGPVEDVTSLVQLRAAEGYDFIKLYSFLSNQQFSQAVRTANKLGKRTVGHIPFAVGLDGVLSGGMDEIAHIEELDFELVDFDRTQHLHPREWFNYLIKIGAQETARYETAAGFDLQRYNDFQPGRIAGVIDKLRSAEIPISTTLIVGETIVRKLLHRQEFLARPENQYLPANYWESFNNGQERHLSLFTGYERFAQSKYKLETILLRELAKAGVPVILATDAGTGGMGIVPGFSIHDELRIMTEYGFTPYEAIAAGTAVASRVAAKMTGADDFGTIAYGKRADLLLVRNNPLADVANLKDLIGVMAAGRWYSRAQLREMIDLRR